MSRTAVVLSLVGAVVTGCDCEKPISLAQGEVRWEWETADGPQSGEAAVIDFGTRAMGSTTNQTVFVRNIGRASFTLSDFVRVVGDPVSVQARVEAGAPFSITFEQDREVAPSERQPITVAFTPAVSADPKVKAFDARSVLDFVPQGAAAASLELKARAISGECEVPAVIDFGTVPVGVMTSETIDLRNEASIAVTVTTTEVTGAGAGAFAVTGFDGRGGRDVAPGERAESRVTFTPTETREYEARFTVRRTASCPVREVRVVGRGVSSCLSFRSNPQDDPRNGSLFLGYVAPGQAGRGTVTFLNACSSPVTLSAINTTDPLFVVTEAAPGDVSRQVVPAAMRTAMGAWADGTADVKLEFRPTALGQRLASLRATTTLSGQSAVAVRLRGVGGGPRIEVRPSPLQVGRIGYTPNASPPTYVPRSLRIANTGTRPMPADPRANLKLGAMGAGGQYWRVAAVMGTEGELCVGEWDQQRNGCTGTLQPNRYDPNVGIEAVATAALTVPIRIIPASPGPKAWDVTIFSNDPLTPETVVRITAEAVEAPPCNYEVLPGQLSFGVIDQPQVRDQQFILRNRGVQPDQVCYFNAIEVTPASDDTFSMPIPFPSLAVGPGQQVPVTVRAQPLRPAPTTPTLVRGEVTFGVSAPNPVGSVLLQATLAPSCVSISPSPLDFMNTELECGSPSRTVSITNTCATPLTLTSATLTNAANAPMGTGTCMTAGGCPQFAIAVAATVGTINPGASRTLQLRHRPFVLGQTTGELSVTVQQAGQTVAYPVVLTGNGVPRTMMGCGVTAVCPGPITTGANSQVPLIPSVMAPGPVSCAWTAGSRPPTSNGTFSAPSSCTNTNYFADVVGTHVVNFTVSDGLGSTSTCSTPITVTPNGDLWVELTWDRNNDQDLHLLHQNAPGSPLTASTWSNSVWDCYFSQRTPNWGTPQNSPSLDRDDISGRGPENTRINSPALNVAYTVGVHMYSWAASPTPVLSTVRIYCGGQLVTTQTRSMNRSKDMWVVGNVQFTGSSTCSFNLVDTIVPNAPP
ncbi:MAG: choice-of-anchor D domain-containing protein [Myxococcaceae bacterium]|nr:choice-of-anchor D domain-containing protein [Myxococcaceae bacterium]